MPIGTLAHSVGKLPLEQLAGKLQGRGVDFVQLALSKAIADIDTGPGRLSAGLANHIAERFDRAGIRIGVLGCYINPIHPDPDERSLEIARFKEHLRFARDFGASIVATETAHLDTYAAQSPDRWEEVGWQTLLQTAEELAEEAERWGVTVGLEPVSYHTLSSAGKTERLLREIPSSALGVVFDPCNLITAEEMANQEAFLDDAFRRFGSRIVLAHLKDAAVTDDGLRTMRTGTGSFRTASFLSKLHVHKPFIDISLEQVNDETLDTVLSLVRGMVGR